MNLNTIVLLLISTIFLNSCADYKTDRTTKKKEKQYYSSIGFALIYEDHHYLNKVVNKKIKNEDSVAMHNLLKINTAIATPRENPIEAVKAQPIARRYSINCEVKSSPISFLSSYF